MASKSETPDIYEDLRKKLVTAQFTPGQKLMPATLRSEYGCSANTIREVLLRLSSVGLVSFAEQRGFRARRSTPERQHDLTTVRIMLEQEGAALSMKNGGIEWEAQLAAAHHKLSHIEARIAATGEIEPVLNPWCTAEWEFHDALNSACGSPVLRETFRSIYDQFRQQLVTQQRNYGYFSDNIKEHEGILAAALGRDVGLCQTRIFDHLSRNLVTEVLTEPDAQRL